MHAGKNVNVETAVNVAPIVNAQCVAKITKLQSEDKTVSVERTTSVAMLVSVVQTANASDVDKNVNAVRHVVSTACRCKCSQCGHARMSVTQCSGACKCGAECQCASCGKYGDTCMHWDLSVCRRQVLLWIWMQVWRRLQL